MHKLLPVCSCASDAPGDTRWVIVCSVDPFSKKDWYEIKAPGAFTVRNVGKTLVTRTAGTKVRQGCWCGMPSLSRCGVPGG